MGGWGSGRQGGRVTIGGCGSCRLSIKDLGHLLRSPAGRAVWLNYRQDGEHLMTVVVEARPEHGYLRLQHPSRAQTGPEHEDYTIRLVTTPAGFGGHRWWFICPVSGQRCAVLWLPRGAYRFGSAAGYGLAYDITRLAPQDRLWHRMRKIARRLGDNDPTPDFPPDKPKWMRTATYDRLLERWHDAAERRDDIYDTKIAGFLARAGRLGG
jgi:hypothetical protein